MGHTEWTVCGGLAGLTPSQLHLVGRRSALQEATPHRPRAYWQWSRRQGTPTGTGAALVHSKFYSPARLLTCQHCSVAQGAQMLEAWRMGEATHVLINTMAQGKGGWLGRPG